MIARILFQGRGLCLPKALIILAMMQKPKAIIIYDGYSEALVKMMFVWKMWYWINLFNNYSNVLFFNNFGNCIVIIVNEFLANE